MAWPRNGSVVDWLLSTLGEATDRLFPDLGTVAKADTPTVCLDKRCSIPLR